MDNDKQKILQQSRESGLTYNEAKEWIAKTTGGRNTHVYSNTDTEQVKQENIKSESNKLE
ncbi:hypothetical protein KQI49_10095 [Virgibacillus sp. MSJ-26]|uniref:hypothetical protein n=1 Tax=Virgibacillus sp. MSJ-26 TaxID=2841522 RepID=UPI001C108F97|nr:hypothetical protein [Virgibacillus sp. MSJ-26]MBU5467170.1 hypothetical protein [Virgibacillus sp. MSJ-26]